MEIKTAKPNMIVRYKCRKHKIDIFTLESMPIKKIDICPECGREMKFKHVGVNLNNTVGKNELVFVRGAIQKYKPLDIYPEFKPAIKYYREYDNLDYDNLELSTILINEGITNVIKHWLTYFTGANMDSTEDMDLIHAKLKENGLKVHLEVAENLIDHLGYLLTDDLGMVIDSYELKTEYDENNNKIIYKFTGNVD